MGRILDRFRTGQHVRPRHYIANDMKTKGMWEMKGRNGDGSRQSWGATWEFEGTIYQN